MGDPLMGRYASARLASDTIANLENWEVSFDFDRIDVSAFGSVWKKEQPGMQGWSGSLEGHYDPADTTGQAALQTAALAATKITNMRFYINSTSYWVPDLTTDSSAGCYIGGLRIRHDKTGVAKATFTVLGFGPLALV